MPVRVLLCVRVFIFLLSQMVQDSPRVCLPPASIVLKVSSTPTSHFSNSFWVTGRADQLARQHWPEVRSTSDLQTWRRLHLAPLQGSLQDELTTVAAPSPQSSTGNRMGREESSEAQGLHSSSRVQEKSMGGRAKG